MLGKEIRFGVSIGCLVISGFAAGSGDPDTISDSNDVVGAVAKLIQPTTADSADAAMAVTVGQMTIVGLEDNLRSGRPTDPTSGAIA